MILWYVGTPAIVIFKRSLRASSREVLVACCEDIMKNVNSFRRHQIVFSPETKTYTLLIREGRIRLQGIGWQDIVSADVKVVVSRFCKIFRNNTGLV
ncbi:hypothetical protein GJ744_003980 [Endocarpon pusillum]|uniref:Uncharacterized protein n=1 Tax=Endocarpon pusillum TaxID=364733 RepID=A0A8H7DZ32_9EURO|nr:hypothetical protein GJ744_003980 [Endocarpon pusillum]